MSKITTEHICAECGLAIWMPPRSDGSMGLWCEVKKECVDPGGKHKCWKEQPHDLPQG